MLFNNHVKLLPMVTSPASVVSVTVTLPPTKAAVGNPLYVDTIAPLVASIIVPPSITFRIRIFVIVRVILNLVVVFWVIIVLTIKIKIVIGA